MANQQREEEVPQAPPPVSTEQAHPIGIEIWQSRLDKYSLDKTLLNQDHRVMNWHLRTVLADQKLVLTNILTDRDMCQKLLQENRYLEIHDFVCAALTIINIAETMTLSIAPPRLSHFLCKLKTIPNRVRRLNKEELFHIMTEFTFASLDSISREKSHERSEFFLTNGLEDHFTHEQISFIRQKLNELICFERIVKTVAEANVRFAMETKIKLKSLVLSATLGIAVNIPTKTQNRSCITLLLASFNVLDNYR